MSEEIYHKITVPLISDEELATFDSNIHSIIEEYSKIQLHKKDEILTQRIIMKQEEEIKQLKNRITEIEEINKQHQKINSELRTKISKAIEYIEEHTEKINKRFTIPKIDFNYNDLLNILQDKEKVWK